MHKITLHTHVTPAVCQKHTLAVSVSTFYTCLVLVSLGRSLSSQQIRQTLINANAFITEMAGSFDRCWYWVAHCTHHVSIELL